jgi:membrane fusion protein, copper/silver efflux system
MRKRRLFIGILAVILLSASGYLLFIAGQKSGNSAGAMRQKDIYYCPMHPGYTSDKPGDCPICGMKLVKNETSGRKPASMAPEKKVIFYRNPMDPNVTSQVPMKDSMGMDYVPVYEESGQKEEGVYISPDKQQAVGINKEKVEKRKLVQDIVTVGTVAYDPDLFVAQQEYLQALKTRERIPQGAGNQLDSLVQASKKKLLLMGMSEDEIEKLAQAGTPQENLYLPGSQDKIWVYATVYEYDIGQIQAGQSVELGSVAFPGEKFSGKIIAITPVLDPMTRSARVRIELDNSERKLKPEMFVNARIHIELGERLSIPDEAVIDTGERSVVFVADKDGYFSSRQVNLGVHAGDYYEVLSGLKEGEEVVSSGNFFVDSESRLKSVINSEHKE